MQASTTSLIARDDTFLGVCEAVGQDLGFHSNWLRLVFSFGLFWNPAAMIAAYLALGAVVLVSRLLFPDARRVPAAVPEADSAAPAEQQVELPLAA